MSLNYGFHVSRITDCNKIMIVLESTLEKRWPNKNLFLISSSNPISEKEIMKYLPLILRCEPFSIFGKEVISAL